MGLFSTTLNIFKKDQLDIVEALKSLFAQRQMSVSKKIEITSDNFENVLRSEVYSNSGVFYLITERHARWTTIIELNVNIHQPIYLYELGNDLSAELKTYALSFHLHDGDVLLYNLDRNGISLDGYNSNVQYFESDVLPESEIISQRHDVQHFATLLPNNKGAEELTEILDQGYWQAFDNDDLDDDGIPFEEYDIVEEDRLKEIGKYLEIYTADCFPYANWYNDIHELNLSKCYLLRIDK
jgi:hypothetical protein